MNVHNIQDRIVDIERRCYQHYDMDELEYQQAVLMGEVLTAIKCGAGPADKLADAALGVLSIRIGRTHSNVSDSIHNKEGEE